MSVHVNLLIFMYCAMKSWPPSSLFLRSKIHSCRTVSEQSQHWVFKRWIVRSGKAVMHINKRAVVIHSMHLCPNFCFPLCRSSFYTFYIVKDGAGQTNVHVCLHWCIINITFHSFNCIIMTKCVCVDTVWICGSCRFDGLHPWSGLIACCAAWM